jgi:hypothetical protein
MSTREINIQELAPLIVRQIRRTDKPVMDIKEAYQVLRERGYDGSLLDASDTQATVSTEYLTDSRRHDGGAA